MSATAPDPQAGSSGGRSPRLAVLLAAAGLASCAAVYVRGGDTTPLVLVIVLGLAAALWARPLPPTTRAMVWSAVLAVVVCLAANVTRVTVPEARGTFDWYRYDRVVTVAFALGVASLFFRPSTLTVTVQAIAGLPLLMLAHVRGASAGQPPRDASSLWLLFLLLFLQDQAHRLAHARAATRTRTPLPEAAGRALVLCAALAASAGLRAPLQEGVQFARQRLMGMVNARYSPGGGGGQLGNLPLSLPPPADFAGRLRVLMTVRAPVAPGYLREAVYLDYAGGTWHFSKAGMQLPEVEPPLSFDSPAAYALTEGPAAADALLWRCDVLQPRALGAFCIPGHALRLGFTGPAPNAETNGSVTAAERLPDRFELLTGRREGAFPGPPAGESPRFLAVPAPLRPYLTNWLAGCEGLLPGDDGPQAAAKLCHHFARHFSYRLGGQLPARPDPLVHFMQRREGHCTLFASACALLLRTHGVPARLVTGYAFLERHPLTGEWQVRERDRHAWVEAWDAGTRAWFVVEPTPPDGRPSAHPRPGLSRLLGEGLATLWRRLVDAIQRAPIIETVAAAGAAVFRFGRRLLWNPAGAAGAALLAAGLAARASRRRRARPPELRLRLLVERAMAGLARRAAPAGLLRRPHESWNGWLERVRGRLPAGTLRDLQESIEAYGALRYRASLDEAAARQWLARARTRRRASPRRAGRSG